MPRKKHNARLATPPGLAVKRLGCPNEAPPKPPPLQSTREEGRGRMRKHEDVHHSCSCSPSLPTSLIHRIHPLPKKNPPPLSADRRQFPSPSDSQEK